MQAAIYDRYGPPDVVRIADMPRPDPGPGEVLIRVAASSVTTADWRMRAAAYPGILWLPGRLMTGVLRPRHKVLGGEVAGRVEALGPGVTGFAQGQRVFGFIQRGGHAEYAVAKADGAILPIPDSLSDAEAAALPFGGLCALVFLRDVARVQPGQSVLIVGASGGVGVYATQVAAALGAEVTGVASAENAALVQSLGATRVIDYRAEDPAAAHAAYDVVFDTVGATDLARMAPALKPGGLFLPLNYGAREIWQALTQRFRGGPRIAIHVNDDRKEDLQTLLDMIAAGTLRPVIDRRFALSDIVAAHAYVEARHRKGAVIVQVA